MVSDKSVLPSYETNIFANKHSRACELSKVRIANMKFHLTLTKIIKGEISMTQKITNSDEQRLMDTPYDLKNKIFHV